MKGLNFWLLSSAIALCTGCPSGVQRTPQQDTSTAEAACAAAAEIACADEAGACPVQTAAQLRLDSIELSEGCDWYTCYFAEGTRNKKALEHIRDVIQGSGGPSYEEFAPDLSPASIDGERALLLDSVRSVEWLDSEPWPSMRRLHEEWWEQELERQWIVYMAKRDPAFLYDCSETDSVVVRYADILGNDRVDREVVRRLKKEIAAAEYAERVARDSLVYDDKELESTFSSIDWVVDRNDPRELLFTTLSNYINHKIHNRLGKDGNIDFFSYKDDFLRVFDSVKVETFEP